MKKDNVLVDKSLKFAMRCVNLYKFLKEEKNEYVISKQILRSGTGIGANIAESQGAQSLPDFIAKLHISFKECLETEYWLKLLKLTDYITEKEYESLYTDTQELTKLLTTILKNSKTNQQKSSSTR